MNYLRLLFCVFIICSFGCAHNIEINPDITKISENNNVEKINGVAGYYFDKRSAEREYVTLGGGGDRVRYMPFVDIEPGFVKVLQNVFKNVIKMESSDNKTATDQPIDYLVSLDISTDSSSTSTFFWPPEWFSVILNTVISDKKANPLTTLSARGEGKASYSEYFSERGLTGKIAMLEALVNLQSLMLSAPELRADGNIKKDYQGDSASKLVKLKALYDSGLITKEEYDLKRSKILDNL